MLFIPKFHDYLEILTDKEVKNFVAIDSSKYCKSIKDEEEKNLRKVSTLLFVFLTTPYDVRKYVESKYSDNCLHHCNVKILNLFDPDLQLIITKLVIKNKLKGLINELKKFKVQTILVLHYKETNDCKIFHSSAKLLDIDEAFKSMHQSIMVKNCTKMKFSIMEFFSKCNQIRSFLLIWQHLLKKSLMENFVFLQ